MTTNARASSALAEAEAARDAARDRIAKARNALSAARTQLAAVRQRATAGQVAPGELSAARDAVEVAELAMQGPEQALAPLEEAVLVARAEDEAERISSTLRSLGGRMSRALEAVDKALNGYALAASAYDGFVTSERPSVVTRCRRSARLSDGGRYGRPSIDGIRLVNSNAMGQLATVLLPVARLVGDRTLADALAEMARSAPILPRDDR